MAYRVILVLGILVFKLWAWNLVALSATSDGFDYPIGPPNGAGYKLDQDFGDFFPGRGYHLGEDWNGIGGGNTDWRNPVYAVSNGTVVFAQNAGPAWGNVIIIQHELPNGSLVQSLYGHLEAILVSSGTVARGSQIGTIGRGYRYANGSYDYTAHLHFEIRTDISIGAGPGYSSAPRPTGWVDPSDFIDLHRPPLQISLRCPTGSSLIQPPDMSTLLDPSQITFRWSQAGSGHAILAFWEWNYSIRQWEFTFAKDYFTETGITISQFPEETWFAWTVADYDISEQCNRPIIIREYRLFSTGRYNFQRGASAIPYEHTDTSLPYNNDFLTISQIPSAWLLSNLLFSFSSNQVPDIPPLPKPPGGCPPDCDDQEGQPKLSVSPRSIDFGSVIIGESSTKSFTVKNSGQGTLSGSASTSAPFSIVSGSSFSLSSGKTQDVTISFSPLSQGTFSETVSFSSNAGDSQNQVSGQGVTQGGTIPPTPPPPPAPGKTIEQALDTDQDGFLGDSEIRKAIDLWIKGEIVPGTNETINDTKILELIKFWIAHTPVGSSNSTSSTNTVCRQNFTGKELQVPGGFRTIQLAVDNANDGDKISISPGVYEDPITINKSLILEGTKQGDNLTQIQVGEDKTALAIVNTKDVVIRDLVLTGSDGAIRINSADGICIEKNSISNNFENGISIVDSNEILIHNNVIKGNAGTGVNSTDSSSVDITQNQIIDTIPALGTAKLGTAISILKGSRFNIKDNTISSNRYQGIAISEASDIEIKNNQIEKLPDKPGTRAAIGIHFRSNVSGATISGNTITVAEIAMQISNSSGITLSDNQISQIKVNGILISNSTRMILERNRISQISPSSVFAEIEAIGIRISKDSRATLRDNTITETLGYGVLIIDGAEAELSQNRITNINGKPGTPGRAIGIDRAMATLSGNTLSNNEGDGIAVLREASVSINGNTITQNGGYGIYADSADVSISCSSNTVSGNKEGSISPGVPGSC